MILISLPIIRALRMPRWQAGIALGIMLWIVGGGAGLLLPNPYMVTPQRYIHIIEIMTQNVALGVTALPLLRRKDLGEPRQASRGLRRYDGAIGSHPCHSFSLLRRAQA